MNVSKLDLDILVEEAQRFGIGGVYVFGSSLSASGKPADLDVAVERVPPGVFFKFYGRLLRRLSRPVDVVDLDIRNPVTRLIAQEAVKVYG